MDPVETKVEPFSTKTVTIAEEKNQVKTNDVLLEQPAEKMAGDTVSMTCRCVALVKTKKFYFHFKQNQAQIFQVSMAGALVLTLTGAWGYCEIQDPATGGKMTKNHDFSIKTWGNDSKLMGQYVATLVEILFFIVALGLLVVGTHNENKVGDIEVKHSWVMIGQKFLKEQRQKLGLVTGVEQGFKA